MTSRRFHSGRGLALALVVAACAPAAATPSPAPASSPPAAVVLDVTTYKAGPERLGVMPGPAFRGTPAALWQHPTDGAPAAPLVVDGQVLVVDRGNRLATFDLATGAPSWTLDLPGQVRTSPTVSDGTLYVVTDDAVLRTFDLGTRTAGWTLENVEPASTMAVDGSTLVVGRRAGGMLVVDPRTGAIRWELEGSPVSRTALSGGRAYGSGDDSGRVSVVDLATGELTWAETNAGRVLTPSISNDTVLVIADDVAGGHDELIVFDRDLGRLREYRVESGDLGGHAVTADRIVLSIAEPAVVIAIDPETLEELWQRPLEGAHRMSIPVPAGDVVFVFAEGRGIVALDAERGTVLWEWAHGGWHPHGVAVTDGAVIAAVGRDAADRGIFALVGSEDPRLAAMATPKPTGDPPVAQPFSVEVNEPLDPDGLYLAVARAPDGTLYIGDVTKHEVLVVRPDGTTTTWGGPGSEPGQFDFSEVTRNDTSVGIAISPDGSIIAVGDAGNGRVQLFEPSGRLLRSIGRRGRGPGQFINSAGVAIDGSGRLWVADAGRHDVQGLDLESGALVATLGSEGQGEGELLRPGPPFVVDASDEVFVPDFGNRRVAVFSTDGTWKRNVGSQPGAQVDEVNGVFVDPSGRLFVLDTTSRIHVFAPDGSWIATLDPAASELGAVDIASFSLDVATGRVAFVDVRQARRVELQLTAPIWPPPA